MAPSKGPYRSSRPATSRASLVRAPLMVAPQLRAAPLVSFPRVVPSPSPSPQTPIKRLGSPYHTPSTPTPPHTPPSNGQLRPYHTLRSSRSLGRRQCVLDANVHPYLVVRIMEWADPSVLRAFRATSSRYLRRADMLLSHHLLIAATKADGEGELAAEICPLRPSDEGLYVPHGRHPALRHLFAPSSAVPTSMPSGAAYGFFQHDPGTVQDLRLAVRQASAVRAVLESTEVLDVAGRLSLQTMRQLRATAVNAQMYRVHLDCENTHLLDEFEQGKRVTLALHLGPGVAALPVQARGFGAVRRMIINVPLIEEGPFIPPPLLPMAQERQSQGQLEIVIIPSHLETMDPDRALQSIRTAYASAITFALALVPGSSPTILGLDESAHTRLGISDSEVEYLLRLEMARLETLLTSSCPTAQHDGIRHSLAGIKFLPRGTYIKRVGEAHFRLESAPTRFRGNEIHEGDERYDDSFSLVEGSSSLALGGVGGALEHLLLLQQAHGSRAPDIPAGVGGGDGLSASPSFVVVDAPEGAEHYFPAPRRRLTKRQRHRRRSSLCILM
ncbi:hypothetical protein A1Q1_04816 [Trichosporon asahii var. asahii CBS 2479]|uniref:Uncharacterized protein n=1 Tax=Trichosporon asahii var. asahii (strain ATCC 90039 / CBS 2479 / JCM 2466 / KCTC 7840 / NBRC 103889/ NCYC 2677 / UAMH 7654) TaxID=1186058 RepID=J6EQ94_TRIAS|nr:hypothetical protein A1Q1_04816 [Trichosporon asahii var. asahii CBS 2479]EJT46639.1 hypothetical protein A1Q1_04816 [Trichosporon asahii var. asahii CBS 2479]